MTKLMDLHASWMSDPGYASAYAALEGEYSFVDASIGAQAETPKASGEEKRSTKRRPTLPPARKAG